MTTRHFLIALSLLVLPLAIQTKAQTKQTVTVSGEQVTEQFVTAMTFDGDKVVLTLGDGQTMEVADMATLVVEMDYESMGINGLVADKKGQKRGTKGVYSLDGRYLGPSAQGLCKGVYIVDGKKHMVEK